MRVLDRVARRRENAQPRFHAEPEAGAKERERQAVDQFHGAKRPPIRRETRIEHACDVRMIQPRQRLAFERETPQPLRRFESGLEPLQRHLAT